MTRPLFESAGWSERRRVDVDAAVPTAHPAFEPLQAFGGLRVGRVGKGIECATSDIAFSYCNQDPGSLTVMQQELGTRLLCVAEVHNSHGWMVVDESGRCFGASQVHDAFWFSGETIAVAIERLLFGYRDRPMLLPYQDEVELYGTKFRRGDPDVFDPKA